MRNYKIDNIKLLLIVLVVFGHLLEYWVFRDETLRSLYVAIYSFHMPLFVILAGFSSGLEIKSCNGHQKIVHLFIILLIFTILYETFYFTITGDLSNYTKNLKPYWILWFLVSLILWKLTLPMVLRLSYPVIICVLLSVTAGFLPQIGYTLGLSRTLYFLPFFILGATLARSPSVLTKLQNLPIAVYILASITILLTLISTENLDHRILYGSYSYDYFDFDIIFSPLVRLIIYAASAIVGITIVLLVPNVKYRFTHLGERTIHVFLWHGFIMILLRETGAFEFISQFDLYVKLLTIIATSLLITLACTRDRVANTTAYLVRLLERCVKPFISSNILKRRT